MRRLALAGLALLLDSSPVNAWGNDGHRVTGHIATELLSQPAKQQLRELLGTDDLALISTWMDDERDSLNQRFPGSSRWHYENRAACANVNSAAKVCPQGQCISRQIERSLTTLKDLQATSAQRADAVRILVHLLGDLHQPLHLIDNDDRGGNDFYVRLPREKDPRRLHEVWDTSLVRMNLGRKNPSAYATELVTRFDVERSHWQTGSIDQWASETHTLALQQVYQTLPGFACQAGRDSEAMSLAATYVDSARTVVATQLAKAGVRIAIVLNEALTAGNPVPAQRKSK